MSSEWGNYIHCGDIGSGQFGKVIKVKDTRDEAEYALKIIPGLNRSQVDKSLREAKALASLEHHHNIVQYYHCWISETPEDLVEVLRDHLLGSSKSTATISSTTSKGQISDQEAIESNINLRNQCLFIKTELCDMNLKSWIETNSLAKKFQTVKEILNLFFQIVVAVKFIHIHEKQFIHRDLKPENILVKRYGKENWHLKIGDFGIVTRERGSSETQSSSYEYGTPLYRAPEMVNADGNITQKVDVYSLGVILLQWLYPADTVMEQSEVIQYAQGRTETMKGEAQKFVTTHSVEWEKIKEMLIVNPESRPTSKNIHVWLKNKSKLKFDPCKCHKNA